MGKKKGFTLVELVIAIVLAVGLIVAISAIESSFYGLKATFLDKQATAVKGNLAMATIFERVLRAGTMQKSAAFLISAKGSQLDYKRGTVSESFFLSKGSLKYKSGSREITLLTGVNSLKFSDEMPNRLTVEMTLSNGDAFRTSVTPRNQATAPSIIN